MNIHDTSIRAVPANVEAEQALLGSIFVDNACFDKVSAFLDAEHFYEPLHKTAFTLMRKMIDAGQGVTPITIKSYLPVGMVGDMTVGEYLIHLAAEAVNTRNARDYGVAVHEMWIRRQLLATAEDVVNLCYGMASDKDILGATNDLSEHLTELTAEWARGNGKRIGHGQSYLASLRLAKHRTFGGVPIALPEIRRVLSDQTFEVGNLYGLLSSSGEGKTSLTLQLIFEALVQGHPVLFLSYDQSPDQCIRQMASQQEGVTSYRQRSGDLLDREMNALVSFAEWIDKQPFEIIRCTDQNAAQLVGFARTFVKRARKQGNEKTPLIVVDHIRAVRPARDDAKSDPGTKANNINAVFKAAAEMIGGPWLVLNQRNTSGMRRDNPRPIAEDLYGGEGARQAYDAIFYLYRFKAHYEGRKDTISGSRDQKTVDKVFPSNVRDGSEDVAEIGAIKVRFGSPFQKEQLIFEANLTRYKSINPTDEGFF